MAQSLEKFFLNKVKTMPPVEVEMSPSDLSKKKGGGLNKGRKVRDQILYRNNGRCSFSTRLIARPSLD